MVVQTSPRSAVKARECAGSGVKVGGQRRLSGVVSRPADDVLDEGVGAGAGCLFEQSRVSRRPMDTSRTEVCSAVLPERWPYRLLLGSALGTDALLSHHRAYRLPISNVT